MKPYQFIQYMTLTSIASISIYIGMYGLKNNTVVMIGISIMMPVIFSASLSSENVILLLGLLLPNNRILTLGSCSVLTLLALLFLLKKFAQKKLCIPKNILLISAIFIFYACVLSQGRQLFAAGKIILMLFFFLIVMQDIGIRKLFPSFLGSVVGGITIGAVITILVDSSSITKISRFTIGTSGGNILGIECGALAICLLIIILQGTENKILMYIQLIPVLLIGLLTASKSFLLELAIGCAWIAIFLFIKSSKRQMRILTFGSLASILGCIVLFFASDMFENYCMLLIRRVISPHAGDISNGRFEIWSQYFKLFQTNLNSLLFGNVSYNQLGINYEAHNMIIEQIALYGIVGSVMLTYLYIKAFQELARRNQVHYKILSFRAAPLAAFLSASMVSHALFGFPQTTLLFLCWMCGIVNINVIDKS